MNKVVWVFGVAALGFASVGSLSASALDVGRDRTLFVDVGGQAGQGPTLGTLSFVPLGANGQFCDYLANVGSPFNVNDVQLCILHEQRTAFFPSCVRNETADIVTILQSGMGGGLTQEPQQPPQNPQQPPQNPTGGSPCGCGEGEEPQNPEQTPTDTPVSQPECAGFNLKGEAIDNVALFLSEGPGGLTGIQVIPGTLPTMYPVRAL